MSSAGCELAAVGLVRRAGARALLDGVSLSVASGDRLAVHGASGAGKSLLLRALAQLDPLDEGEVTWCGEAVPDADVPRFRSRVVYHQQHPAFAEGSVESNLRHPFELSVHAERRYERSEAQRLLSALDRASSLLDASVLDLSGGERQIVALVRLLLLEPTILLLDEPTSAIDPPTQEAAVRMLRGWVAEDPSRAYVWVTHDESLATRVAARRFRVVAGRLRASSGTSGDGRSDE